MTSRRSSASDVPQLIVGGCEFREIPLKSLSSQGSYLRRQTEPTGERPELRADESGLGQGAASMRTQKRRAKQLRDVNLEDEPAMAERQLRFVHASDLHLEQPLHGVTEVPEHLRALFLDAALSAAEKVFDTVVEEEADFLLLSGHVLHLRAGGARAIEFLWKQFCRLRDHGIAVYWCDSGRDKIEQWPAAVPLPPNVNWFASEHVERITHRHPDGKDDRRDVIIYGMGTAPKPSEWDEFKHTGDPYAIAMAHTEEPLDPKWLDGSIDYWALGGRHSRENLGRNRQIHFCGSPQGRRPTETGPHGCAVVDVDYRGATQRHTVTSDIVRWHEERIELPMHVDSHGLLRIMRDRMHALAEVVGGRQTLVTWKLSDGDQTADTSADLLASRLRQGQLTGEVLDAVRREYGLDVPGIWSLTLELEPPDVLPAGWYEEDTVLGDLLRLVQTYQEDESLELATEPWKEESELGDWLRDAIRDVHPTERTRLLRQVAILGVDVMRGDRVLSDEFVP